MPLTATVSTSGMTVVQLMASSTAASSICQNPSDSQSRTNEPSDPQVERDEDGAASADAVGEEADGRREDDADVKRRRQENGDLVGVEMPPFQPDRQIRHVEADHQEQRGIKEAEPPGEARPRGGR